MKRAALGLLSLLLLGAGPGRSGPGDGGPFLTGPSRAEPLEIALGYLRDEQLQRGVAPGELTRWKLTDRHRGARDGVTYLYLRQEIGGIEVWNRNLALTIGPDGRLAGQRVGWVAPERARARPRSPQVGAGDAVWGAAAQLGLTSGDPIALDAVETRLVYLELPGDELRLVWLFDLRADDTRFWWEVIVDATTGEVLSQLDRIRHAEYKVFALPLESPDDGGQTTEVDPADLLASPFGWHDTNGVVGEEFTRSQGNNVAAADNSQNGAMFTYAEGGMSLVFDSSVDLSQPLDSYQPAATTNLFYWNNILHDIHFRYGFDEAAGNFQVFHYGVDPTGQGDGVVAFSQDFNAENNASMATGVDGSSPIMRMHVWSVPVTRVTAPPGLVSRYDTGGAEFGPDLDAIGVSGDVVLGVDGVGDPGDACTALTNGASVAGNIALVDRGSCNFITKVDNAETAGAIAVIVANNLDGGVFTMGAPQGRKPKIDVPSVFVRRSLGQATKDAIGNGDPVTVTLSLDVRDSDLDDGVIVHEFGHGVSTRLVGGKSNASCLLSGQGAGMGEGWGDFWTLAITAKPGEVAEDPRGVGSYLVGEPGIRNFPYSADLAVNPQTLADVATTNAPHGVGEIWAQALWDLYWLLVEDFGFDPDFYTGTGGNNIALELVIDSLKQTPCNPDFVDARNALLTADVLSHGGAHECRIWRAFAKRGIGPGADATLLTEDFALPPACPLCGDANVDGLVDANDPDVIRNHLAFDTLTPTQLSDCEARAFSGSCGVLEVVLLRRGLAGLVPGLDSSCAAVP